MKLILTREVTKLGSAGDVVTVKDGYARNFLLPRGVAIAWSLGGEKQIEGIRRARAAREVRDIDHAKEIKAALEKASIVITVKVGANGRLFGSVTDKDVAAAIKSAVAIDEIPRPNMAASKSSIGLSFRPRVTTRGRAMSAKG